MGKHDIIQTAITPHAAALEAMGWTVVLVPDSVSVTRDGKPVAMLYHDSRPGPHRPYVLAGRGRQRRFSVLGNAVGAFMLAALAK